MRRQIVTFVLGVAVAVTAAGGGCREEGPGERLGRALDEAATDIRDAMEEEVDDALRAAEDAADEASERIREETDAAAEKAHEAIDEAAGRTRS